MWKNFFIILKIRSHAKYLHFCELNMKTRRFLRIVSLSASSLVVLRLYCNLNVVYLHDSTECYKHRTTLVQPYFVVRCRRILNSLINASWYWHWNFSGPLASWRVFNWSGKLSNVLLDDVMKMADWSHVSTFQKIYYKPVVKSN